MNESVLIYTGTAIVLVLALAVRRRTLGRFPGPRFWLAALIAVIATIIGTNVKVSGVLLAVIAGVPVAWAILSDRWRLGDTGLLLTILGFGTGGAYLLAAMIDPDTGSFADQGAIVLVVLGALLSLIAIAWSLIRRTSGA